MTDELPEFNERPFTCPLCGKETVVITPMDHIFATRVTCNECGKEFSIVNDKPKHLPQ
jgi:transcription elongation factor Elf1